MSMNRGGLQESGSDPPTKQQAGVESTFPANETESLKALEELRLLCDTMDHYLGRQMRLQRGLDPTVTKVTFNDLWYIFKPGYEVRTPGESQIQV